MNVADIFFVSLDRRFTVTIRDDVLQSMTKAAIKAGVNETGGILIGEIDADGRAVVTEATTRPRGSRFGWSSFVRGTAGLTRLLRQRWEHRQHYLGEWHSHPYSSPEPSGQDRRSMIDIANDENYHCREPILVIVGTMPLGAKLSVTVFPRRQQEVKLSSSEYLEAVL